MMNSFWEEEAEAKDVYRDLGETSIEQKRKEDLDLFRLSWFKIICEISERHPLRSREENEQQQLKKRSTKSWVHRVHSSGSTEAKMFWETSIEVERRKWGITEKENDAAGAQLRLSWCKKLVQPMTHTPYWPSSKSITSNYWASSTGPTAVRLVTTPASSTTGCIFTPVCQCTRICPHWPSRTTTGPAEVQLTASSIQCVDVHTGPAAARLLVSLQILCFHGWSPI